MSRYSTHSSDSVGGRSQNESPPSSIVCPNSKTSPSSSSIVGKNQNSSQYSSLIKDPQKQTQAHSADSLFNICLAFISKHLSCVESLQHFPQLVAEKLLSRSLSSLSHNTECTLRVLRLFVNAYGVDFMTSFKAFSDGFDNGIGSMSSNQVSESSLNGIVYRPMVLYLVILYMYAVYIYFCIFIYSYSIVLFFSAYK